MKRNIKTLVALFALALGMTSCLSSIEETNTDYPTTGLPIGVYQTQYSKDSMSYTVVNTVNAKGEPMLYMVGKSIKTADSAATPIFYYVSSTGNYEAVAGQVMSSSATTYYGDGNNGTEKLGAKGSLSALTVFPGFYSAQLVTSDSQKRIITKVKPVSAYPELNTTWATDTAEKANPFVVEFGKDSCVYKLGGAALVKAPYTFQNGKVTINGATTLTAQFNDKCQLVFSLGQSNVVVYPKTTPSQPEEFEEMGAGVYVSGLFKPANVSYFVGNRGTYAFAPFIMNENGFYFKMGTPKSNGARSIAFDPQKTGYVHVQDGQKLGMVYAVDKGNGEFDGESVFTFNTEFLIPGVGGFGVKSSTLTLNPAPAAPSNIRVSRGFLKSINERAKLMNQVVFKGYFERF